MSKRIKRLAREIKEERRRWIQSQLLKKDEEKMTSTIPKIVLSIFCILVLAVSIIILIWLHRNPLPDRAELPNDLNLIIVEGIYFMNFMIHILAISLEMSSILLLVMFWYKS